MQLISCSVREIDFFQVNADYLHFNLYLFIINYLNWNSTECPGTISTASNIVLAILKNMWKLWVFDFNSSKNDFIIIISFTFSFFDINVNVSHYSNCNFDELRKLKPQNPKLMEVTRTLPWFFCFWLVHFFICWWNKVHINK